MRIGFPKLFAKLKFYFSLNHEIAALQRDMQTLVHNPPWLPLLNQDRFRLMEKLEEQRQLASYKRSFTQKNPLITVRIATYNNSDELLNRAIPSVINQTYQNWEIVIVGDYCTDDTAERIKALNHPRIRFVDLSYHYPYPEYQIHRWMAQGLLAHNEAMRLAKGTWIAPLDDDNEFLPHHLESLLHKAQRDQLELVYGNMISIDRETGEEKRVGAFPPQVGTFDYSACIYNAALKVFPFDINSYLYQEVGDTNLIRRLREAGVRMGFVNKFVTKYYFRKPGSQRSGQLFPKQKNTYSLLSSIGSAAEELDYEVADTLMHAITDTTGDALLIGDDNKKVTAFVKKIFTEKLHNPSSVLDTVIKKKQYDLVICNDKKTTISNLIEKILADEGLLFTTQKISYLTAKGLTKINASLWMKI